MPNQKVAEYELYKRIKILGEGSFGKAYLVECVQDKSIWVAKYMDLQAMTKQEQEETLREAKILEFLSHPNIVKFKEVYKTKKGRLCIVMEYADGGDLAKRIKDAKGVYFSENQILDWFTQMCLAIKHVHDRKIIHRDLKGQNIFVTKQNSVKLGDFGIARILKKTMEKAKTMVGTPYYISPEIIEGKPYSLMTDIWSLGVILYEMCALQPPFNGDSLRDLALKIVRGSYSPIPGHYSKELRSLLAQLLSVDQRRRPTIQEILKLPVITNRIKGFLTETVRLQEFSHTILHNRAFEPKGNIDQVNLISKEQPCPPEQLKQNLDKLREFPQIQQQQQIQKQAEKQIEIQRPPQFGQGQGQVIQLPQQNQQQQQQLQQQPQSQPSKPKSEPGKKEPSVLSQPPKQLVKPEPVKSKDTKSDAPPNKRQNSNGSDQSNPVNDAPLIRQQSAQQFQSPKQNQQLNVQRPPTAIKEGNPRPPISQRPQSSVPQDKFEKPKGQKIIVEKKRPISVDKAQDKPDQKQVIAEQQRRQEERIKLLKEKNQLQVKENKDRLIQEKIQFEKEQIARLQRQKEQLAQEQAAKEQMVKEKLQRDQQQQLLREQQLQEQQKIAQQQQQKEIQLKEQKLRELNIKEQIQKEQQQREQQAKEKLQKDQEAQRVREIEIKQQQLEQKLKEQQKKNEQTPKQQNLQQNQGKEKNDKDNIFKEKEQNKQKPLVNRTPFDEIQSKKEQNLQARQDKKDLPKRSNGQFVQGQQENNEKMIENQKNMDMLLKELESVLANVNERAELYPQSKGLENIFDYNTQLMPQQIIEKDDDREDDDEEPEVVVQPKQKLSQKQLDEYEQRHLQAMYKNDQTGFEFDQIFGKEKYDKTLKVLKQKLKEMDEEMFEKKYGPSYEIILPFLNSEERKYIPLMIIHIK
ncbi:hypothetical protein pb186bvf_004266 [Paramecium bursaria]